MPERFQQMLDKQDSEGESEGAKRQRELRADPFQALLDEGHDLVVLIDLVNGLAQKHTRLTRLTTRISPEEMNHDPIFEADPDAPFALLSVSMDEKVDTLRESRATGEITWRCWWDRTRSG